ncbi:calcium-binding protein [Microcoleus sp. FACHB-672]|uniref:calcium-binding protein n=1 Tax=Microcoleus sp. FACHB-672 TaxID=2692825 RepID=UPI0016849ECC|nr:calcium-binding protein [Microcoleus sp. FACHB-672]MBD2041706.1 calcium-binding protein [Microcoleus sp. FACHB-672]
MATIIGTSWNDNLPRLTDPNTSGNDSIYGLAGNDTLNGGIGIDTLVGGLQNDLYLLYDITSDVIIEGVGAGTDSVYSLKSYTLGANVENLDLIGTSLYVRSYGYGNELNNYIDGDDNGNYLWGGVGIDTMVGDFGNDTYSLENTRDVVIEDRVIGDDIVYSYASYTLSANIEDLYILGSAYYGHGNELNNRIGGNAQDNYLWGGWGGSDTMSGGLGNDRYDVTNYSNMLGYGGKIIEEVGAGTDIVYSYHDHTLNENVENLYLQGNAGKGYGNTLNNRIWGNAQNNNLLGDTGNDSIYGLAGNDTLDGGAGIDIMEGGSGSDRYYIDNINDVVIEGVGDDIDSVFTSINYTLGTNVENLFLGGSAYYGYGNALNNRIWGNAQNNYLWGAAGIDTMTGGLGSDRYDVNDTTDVVVEDIGAGTDIVYSYNASYTLSANVENLHLVGSAYYGYGNELNNYIVGTPGNNYLWGNAGNDRIKGGVGIDVLIGGTGADYFSFDSATQGMDTITDFKWYEGDKIALSSTGFGGGIFTPSLLITTSGVIPGTLHPSQFIVGTAATNSSHRIIYNQSTGALSFDRDGTGAIAQVQFAALSPNTYLSNYDIQVLKGEGTSIPSPNVFLN